MKKQHIIFALIAITICIALAVYFMLSQHLGRAVPSLNFENEFTKADASAMGDDVKEIFTLYIQGGRNGLIIEFDVWHNATITLYSNALLLVDNSTQISIGHGFGLDYSCDPAYSQQILLTPEEYAEVLKMLWQTKNVVNHVTYEESVNWYTPNFALRIGNEIYYADGNHYPEDAVFAFIQHFCERIDDNMLRYRYNPENPRDINSGTKWQDIKWQ